MKSLKEAIRSAKEQSDNAIDKALLEFFIANPNPDDGKFHDWAESKGFNVHKAEAGAYKLATVAVAFLSGGRAKAKGFTIDKADSAEVAKGIKIEYEHVNADMPKEITDMIATRITLDHLSEIKDYNTRLLKMEKDAEA